MKTLSYADGSLSQYDVSMDFDEFVSHGGKLILFTSWNDMSISPWQIINQYQKLVKKYGKKKADSFMKFYCMPSATHYSSIRMDYLEWLDTWCSEEKYPEETLYGVIEKRPAVKCLWQHSGMGEI